MPRALHHLFCAACIAWAVRRIDVFEFDGSLPIQHDDGLVFGGEGIMIHSSRHECEPARGEHLILFCPAGKPVSHPERRRTGDDDSVLVRTARMGRNGIVRRKLQPDCVRNWLRRVSGKYRDLSSSGSLASRTVRSAAGLVRKSEIAFSARVSSRYALSPESSWFAGCLSSQRCSKARQGAAVAPAQEP